MTYPTILGSAAGARIAGGCDECDAYQVMADRPDDHGIWRLSIYHDDTCPALR